MSAKQPDPRQLSKNLVDWYKEVRRPLPWRSDRNPYRIWVSEVMLQQTTVTAVIPFFNRFMERFPNLEKLATAKTENVVEQWAGLGYYSRARSLHKSAQAISSLGKFPETHEKLLELPGFGPYTSRAVASLAFGERVGVVDGNVIRVLSRVFDLDLEWWKTKDRDQLQKKSDELAKVEIDGKPLDPSDINQGLMELGATICTAQSPSCMICPWLKMCVAKKNDTVEKRPRSKPRRESEIWLWRPEVRMRAMTKSRDEILFVENNYAPFLKGHLILPGTVTRLKKKPKIFDFKGGVTHHEIFVCLAPNQARKTSRPKTSTQPPFQWISQKDLKTKVPSSLIRKAIDLAKNKAP